MKGNFHVRFGEGGGETHWSQDQKVRSAPTLRSGTFLFYVILKIYEEVVTNRKQAGQWKQKSKELLNRIFGFELLIAPYVVSHLKLGLLLKRSARRWKARKNACMYI